MPLGMLQAQQLAHVIVVKAGKWNSHGFSKKNNRVCLSKKGARSPGLGLAFEMSFLYVNERMSLLEPHLVDSLLKSKLSPFPVKEVHLNEAQGRILARDVHADRNFPPFDRIMMDGISLRQSELQEEKLTVLGLHPAGQPAPTLPLGLNCYQTMTGAPLPIGADTVVPVELLEVEGDQVKIMPEGKEIAAGKFIHRAGTDARKGDLLLKAGTRISAPEVALLATVGLAQVPVAAHPKILIVSTGNEVVPVEDRPLPHQIRRSNGYALAAAVAGAGFGEATLHHLPDDLEATRDFLQSALKEYDLILTTGGISKGETDYLKPVLVELVGQPTFHGVAQRPGKPLAHWATEKCHLFALPGNPNSTMACFFRYVLPLLKQAAGGESEVVEIEPTAVAIVGEATLNSHRHPDLTLLLFAKQVSPNNALEVQLLRNSGDLVGALSATHLLELPPLSANLSSFRQFPLR